jgi:hypothetical protein
MYICTCCPKNGVLTVHYGVEETTVNVRKMLKKFDWTYLLIWRSLKVALNRSIILKYWVPQNSRNNSMRQCQFMLENNEKNNLKILYLLDLKIWGPKRCSFDIIYFK